MQSLAQSANFFVHAHFPPIVEAVRRFRTAGYRRASTRRELKAALERSIDGLARSGDINGARAEVRLARQLTSSPIVEINNTWNIDCVMCKTSLATRKKGKMADEVLNVVLGRYGEMGIVGVELHTIGDPLANPNLRHVLAELRKRRLTTAITTNGLLLSRHWETLLDYADVCRGVTFSIDGATKETYERIRLGGKWEALLANMEIARQRLKGHLPLRTNMVVSRDNRDEVGQQIERFRDLVEEPSRDMHFSLLNSLSPDNTYFHTMNLFPDYTTKNIGCRFTSGEGLFAHIDGRASVCCRDYDGTLVIGDLKQQTVPEVWSSSRLAELRDAHQKGDLSAFPMCDTCFVVDDRIHGAFSLFMRLLLHGRAREQAAVYQQAVNRFIEVFSRRPLDAKQALGLLESLEIAA
jgi:MoaA/NifB/PqqE/SkfB family radical SAM enzyme